MAYEREGRGDPQRDRYGRWDQDNGPDYGGGSSAREYQAAGQFGGGRGGYGSGSGGSYGDRDRQGYDRQEQGYGARDRASSAFGDQNRDEWRGQGYGGGGGYYRGDSDRGDQGRQVHGGEDRARDTDRQTRGNAGRPSRDDDDRGFLNRAGDEVRSWFGDEEAERRREADARRDEQGGYGRDEHYHSWRNQQLQAFDRDYHEYRQENQSKFHNEFASFRTERQGQRELLNGVQEHAEVVGSDGEHVGTVDKVRGDRIILTKNDQDAGGRHHSIPSRWLQTAEGTKVTLRKTASEAKAHWRDEERQGEQGAMFGDGGEQKRSNEDGSSTSGTNLNRSFSGTY